MFTAGESVSLHITEYLQSGGKVVSEQVPLMFHGEQQFLLEVPDITSDVSSTTS